jgi:hypothetical protein
MHAGCLKFSLHSSSAFFGELIDCDPRPPSCETFAPQRTAPEIGCVEDEGYVRAIFRSVRDPFGREASPLKEALARLGTLVVHT